MSSKVLILDDDEDFNSLLTDIFEQADYDVTSLEDPLLAVDIFANTDFDLVVTDHRMPEMTGTEFMKKVKEMKPETPVIMVSGYLENDAIRDLISDGVGGVFLKPLNIFSLLERTSELLEEARKVEASNDSNLVDDSQSDMAPGAQNLEFRFRSYPCKSETSLAFAERLYGLRNFKSTLTLTGEPGMHFRAICEDISGFYDRNFEHFIFFDKDNFEETNILGEMKRAMDSGNERVTCVIVDTDTLSHSQKTLAVSVSKHTGPFEDLKLGMRTVFCLSRDLDALFDQELICEDLYILMGTAEVPVPPLRECKDDISIMAQKMAVDSFRELGKSSVPHLDATAKEFLKNHNWPGNYKELKEIIRRAMELSRGETIQADDLMAAISGEKSLSERERFTEGLKIVGGELVNATWKLLGKDTIQTAAFFGVSSAAVEKRLKQAKS